MYIYVASVSKVSNKHSSVYRFKTNMDRKKLKLDTF